MPDLYPPLAEKTAILRAVMGLLGHPMHVTAGVRTDAEQIALYAQGRTAPGSIVTECNGTTQRSAHQVGADGYGHAVDHAFDGATPFVGPWSAYGSCAEALGLRWGGAFEHLVDNPHVELEAPHGQ